MTQHIPFVPTLCVSAHNNSAHLCGKAAVEFSWVFFPRIWGYGVKSCGTSPQLAGIRGTKAPGLNAA